MPRLSAEKWLHVGLAASLVLLAATSWVAWRARVRVMEAERQVAESHDLTLASVQALRALAEAESAARAHAISGDAVYRDEAVRATAAARSALESLAGAATGHEQHAGPVSALREEVDELLRHAEKLVRVRHEDGKGAAERHVLAESHANATGRLRWRVEDLLRAESEHLRELEVEQARAARAPLRAALLALGGSILLGGLALAHVRRDMRRRQEAQRVSDELARLVGAAEDAILGLTPEGLIRSWNAGAERLFGWPADAMIGKSVLEIVPPPLQAEAREQLARLARGERVPAMEAARRRRDGSLVAAWIVESPVRDGEGRVVAISSIARADEAGLAGGDDTVVRLRQAAARAASLRDLLPTCAWCKAIRDERGEWRTFESYLGEHLDASFTHGICPACSSRLHGAAGASAKSR